MSKKSRRRNKKILAALALAGGAAMLGKRGVPQGVSGADKAAFTSDAAYKLPAKNWITKKDTTTPVDRASKIIPRGAGHPIIKGNINRYAKAIADANTAGHGTANYPGANPYRVSRVHPRAPGNINQFNTGLKKGGRVTGIAKRGFGRALMKGKK